MPACEQVAYLREQLDRTIRAIEGPTEAPEDSETVEGARRRGQSRRALARRYRPSAGHMAPLVV